MNNALKNLIGQAQSRIAAEEEGRQAARRQEDEARMDDYSQKFRHAVENCLGPEVLQAIGPVKFEPRRLEPTMSFQVDGRSFELRTVGVPPGLAQIVETSDGGFSYTMRGHQFNLIHQPNAKDIFLQSLDKALSTPSRL